MPEQQRLDIKNATTQIQDIANILLQKTKRELSSQNESRLMPQMLQNLIDLAISEKRMQYGDRVHIEFEKCKNSHRIFSFIKVLDFSRVLSNIVNNSVEAIKKDKRIEISLMDEEKSAIIQVRDYGKGISPEILNQLGELGNSFGKTDGIGVGLHHAFCAIDTWDGKIYITSQVGQGTTVKIILPKCQPPMWFVPEIKISHNQKIVVIDDDETIHTIWEKRFKNFEIGILHFYSPEEVMQWKKSASNEDNVLYLCDYEFVGHEMNGIDLINKLQINYSSILVTNSVIDKLALRCEAEHIKLLPKNIALSIPIMSQQ